MTVSLPTYHLRTPNSTQPVFFCLLSLPCDGVERSGVGVVIPSANTLGGWCLQVEAIALPTHLTYLQPTITLPQEAGTGGQ